MHSLNTIDMEVFYMMPDSHKHTFAQVPFSKINDHKHRYGIVLSQHPVHDITLLACMEPRLHLEALACLLPPKQYAQWRIDRVFDSCLYIEIPQPITTVKEGMLYGAAY